MKVSALRRLVEHGLFLAVFLGAWEWAAGAGRLNPTFFGRPTGVLLYAWKNLALGGALWVDLGWTVGGVLLSFALGALAAVAVGLAFVTWPRLEAFADPYFTALNAMPRLALAPLFILWFGLGLGSKVAIGFSLTFFIVLANTVAGIRGVNPDHVTLCRTLGATPRQLFMLVTLPGAVPVIFSGLRLGLIFAMLGVVGGEIIAAERGLGQKIAYLGSTFDINGVMALLLLMSLLGVAATGIMTWLEKRLIAWQ